MGIAVDSVWVIYLKPIFRTPLGVDLVIHHSSKWASPNLRTPRGGFRFQDMSVVQFQLVLSFQKITGRCSTPNQLLICSSFSRENSHPLLICSSLSTSQIKHVDLQFNRLFPQKNVFASKRCLTKKGRIHPGGGFAHCSWPTPEN